LRFVSDSLQHHTSDLPLPTTTHRRNDAKLAEKLSHFRALGDTTRPEVSCLRLHLLEADDTELRGMRPFALADQWQTDRDKTLSLFLHATREGLLEMDWEVLCPNCRVPKAQFKSLRDLSPKIHCELCQIGFEADLDSFIELRFNVAPSVRATSNALYCIGSPNRFPHVLVQANLAPKESRTYSINLPAEPLRCRTIKNNVSLEIEPEAKSGVTELKLTFDGKAWKSGSPVFRPGPAVIAIANESDSPATVDLECLVWKSQAVTAAYVTCLQEFRSLFALEILAPDKQVGVRSITILFSDLKASTELYERIGDAPAFSRVQRHFDYVLGIVERHHGAVVKTMGDAVMAVFSDPGQALEAALTLQSGLEEFCRNAGIEPSLSVKLGIHCGSAISLNANGTLDYFGRTINIAARLQAKSDGDDIVVSSEFLEDERVRAALARLPIPLRPFRSRLKGIDGDQLLYRMRLNRKTAARRAA
jgi:class 3 adenylate cyclase